MRNLRAIRADLLLSRFGVRVHRSPSALLRTSEVETSRSVNFRAIYVSKIARASGPASLTLRLMNWEAIAAISQLVGSIAVVVSVLYLAVQLRSSTRVARVAAQDAAAAALRDVTKPFMENAELARIW